MTKDFRFASLQQRLCLATATLVLGASLAVFGQAPANAQSLSLIRDAEIERNLRNYSDPILAAAGLSPEAVDLYVVNDKNLNAFVAGGQNIFMNTGMIMTLETPNQLKGVIAHEAGHISGGHLVRGPEAYEKLQTPVLITALLGVAAIAAGAPDLGAGLIMGSQHIGQRGALSYSRTQESAADQAGVKFLHATGQSPRGMVEVFERFADQEILSGQRQDPFVRSHPMSRERVSALIDLVETSPFKDRRDSAGDQLGYDLMKAKLIGFINRPDAALRAYPVSDQSQPARYARAIAYFRGADLERGLREIDTLIQERPAYPFFWEMKGQMLVESARPKEGLAPYRKAAQLAPNEPLITASLGAALLAAEDEKLLPEAMAQLKQSIKVDPNNAMAWYHLATAYERSGDEARAQLATAERYFAIKNPLAAQFASRAMQKLKAGSVDWQRARDIVAVAQKPDRENRQTRRFQLQFAPSAPVQSPGTSTAPWRP